MDEPTIPDINGADVQAAMEKAGITEYYARDCSICGYPLAYYVNGDDVQFDRGCDCGPRAPMQPRSYDDIAEHHNIQSSDKWRSEIRRKLGFEEANTL